MHFYLITNITATFGTRIPRGGYYLLAGEGEDKEVPFYMWIIIGCIALVLLSFLGYFLFHTFSKQLGFGPFSKYFKKNNSNKAYTLAVLGSHFIQANRNNVFQHFAQMRIQLFRYFGEKGKYDQKELQELYKLHELSEIASWINEQYTQEEKEQLMDMLINILFLQGSVSKNAIQQLNTFNQNLGLCEKHFFATIRIRLNHHTSRSAVNAKRHQLLEILELPRNTTDKAIIKKQYRDLAKKYHPDANKNENSSTREDKEQHFLAIKAAYEELMKK
jgi:DnaJ-domain-containing protein 1